jgi:dipeptidyl-peptidase-4
MDLGVETDTYVPRVNWLPDSKHLAIQRLNRAQTILDMLLCDTTTGKSVPFLSDKDAYWINVSDDLRFLKDGKRFLWSSERSGYRHLYLYDFSGKQPLQLTKGDWEVSHVDAVDEAKDVVYFTATEKSPLERHLYRVGLDGSGFTRITTEEGTHRVNFAPEAATYVDTYSNASTPARSLSRRWQEARHTERKQGGGAGRIPPLEGRILYHKVARQHAAELFDDQAAQL